MLLRFVASNFLSFDEEFEFNLFPYTRLREQKDHIYETPQVSILKAAAIYGANGSGKSNLVRAIQFLRDAASGNWQRNPTVNGQPFLLHQQADSAPSCLEIEFFHKGKYFAYGIELIPGKIKEEYLYETFPLKEEQSLIFCRSAEGDSMNLKFSDEYMKSEKDRLKIEIYTERFTEPNASILPVLAADEAYVDISLSYEWLYNKLNFVHPNYRVASFGRLFVDFPAFAEFSKQILPQLDTGVVGVEVRQMAYDTFFGLDNPEQKVSIVNELREGKGYKQIMHRGIEPILVEEKNGALFVHRIMFQHRASDGQTIWFDFAKESDGTLRIVDLLAPLFSAIYLGHTIVIDEIGRSLHPELLSSLLKLYMRSKTKGQLIFTTHEEYVLDLDIFRRDEIWFMDKKLSGASSISRLHEFKVRSDLDVHKGYLNGRFGGTPRTAALDRMELSHG